MLSEEQIAKYIRKISNVLWPKGIWAPPSATKTAEQRELTRIATLSKIKTEVPGMFITAVFKLMHSRATKTISE
jgi:hypothetical protein